MTATSNLSASNKNTSLNSQGHDIHYRLDFERYLEHLVDVTLSVTTLNDCPSLWLPAWIPGSYMLREFARNITAVHYQIIDKNNTRSESYRAQKLDKNTWQLPQVKAGQHIEVQYEVYCYDLSVRTAYVDQQRLYGNFTSLVLAVEGQESCSVQVHLIVPKAFLEDKQTTSDDKRSVVLACGLPATQMHTDEQHGYGLQADSYHELIDYPFEIALQDKFDFIIQDHEHKTLSHQFYLSGKHNADMGRLQQDITQICQTYLNWLGDAPFNDYTFMTYASGQDYGGLEHINSTSLITPRDDLPSQDEPALPSDSYQRYLGLCSHEYFHSWWVKTVRPDVMLNVDLRREAFTPLLWVFEGFTSYIDDFMLQASGVIDKPSYLKLLGEQISRYYQTAGRGNQSVAESSFDAWIKLYRSDENTGNAGISYYNKGALVALCLDLLLLQQTNNRYRLFDVIKTFYEQAKQQDNKRIGISSADMGAVIGQFMPMAEWQDFEQRYVNGVEELPIEALLTANGVNINAHTKETFADKVPWGMRCNEVPEGMKVTRVQRASAAAKAGISAHDVIIAIDGIKANNQQLAKFSKASHDITCHLFRRDELMAVTVVPATDSGNGNSNSNSNDNNNGNNNDNGNQKADDYPYKVNLSLASTTTTNGNANGNESTPVWQAWLEVLSR